ncbi:hypothetical protein R3P38DRAFT_3268381 [Favolaschia claudopus]|uniref:Uncharacterized protein n=1 Tax=Favolaschia claudopus TaxID=2862362 RepID=A0AAW0BJT9_9AGAR
MQISKLSLKCSVNDATQVWDPFEMQWTALTLVAPPIATNMKTFSLSVAALCVYFVLGDNAQLPIQSPSVEAVAVKKCVSDRGRRRILAAISTLADAMNAEFDGYYDQLAKVKYDACYPYHNAAAEGRIPTPLDGG